MILGVLSVIKAASLHQQVGMLTSTLAVRLWLSRGKAEPYWPGKKPKVDDTTGATPAVEGQTKQKLRFCSEFDELPLESSISALKVIEMPQRLLSVALIFFIVGFLLYTLLLSIENVSSKPADSRNLFIALVVLIMGFIIWDSVLTFARVLNQAKRHQEFGNTHPGKFGDSKELDTLEKDLKAARRKPTKAGDNRRPLSPVSDSQQEQDPTSRWPVFETCSVKDSRRRAPR